MNKTLKVSGIVVGILGVFAAGSFVGASTDWKTNAINSAYNSILGTGHEVNNEIVADAPTDINNAIQTEIASTVESKEDELKRLLEQYYQMKLDGLTETAEFKSLENTINEIMLNVAAKFKEDIDKAFEEAGQ